MRIPYGHSHANPYWGPTTSAVNFCEEDYIITRYIAEFINTLTSLFYIGYAIHGIQRTTRYNGTGLFSPFTWSYWGLIGVGTCSGIYHSTLKYHTQMADEMSMHLATGCVLIQVFSFEKTPEVARRNAIRIATGLTAFVIYHCVTDEFLMHVAVFFGTTMTVSWKTRDIIRRTVKDQTARRRLSGLTTFGTGTALFAWCLWNVDVHLCGSVTKWKHAVGMPLGFLLELHGWWHFLTAIAAYTFMAMVEFLTCPEYARENGYHGLGFAWPVRRVLEDMVKGDGQLAKAANGSKES